MDSGCEKQYGKRRWCGELEESQLKGKMQSLPRDLILDILSRLPIKSLVQSKFVCRAWHALAQDPTLATKHLSRASMDNPCLILHSDNPIRNQLYFVDISVHDEVNERAKRIDAPFWNSMPEFDVVGSCNGLLCLSDSLYKDAIYVYNPFTRDYTELPHFKQYLNEYLVLGFGFYPTAKEYKVVKIAYYTGSYPRARTISCAQSEVQIFTLGSSTWRSLGNVPHLLDRRSSVALVNGRLHWVTCWHGHHAVRTRDIISFDLAEDKFQEVPICGGLNKRNYQLLVYGGCLAAAIHFISYRNMEIWVMKDYNVKESWVMEVKIGAYVPKGLNQNMNRPYRIYKKALYGNYVRVVCLLKNGNLLLAYKCRALVTYDPEHGTFNELVFQGMPNWFQTTVHMGSLCWIDTP